MTYEVLTTEKEILELIHWHNENSEYVVIDLETTGLDSFKDEIIDIQLGGKTDEDVFIFSGAFAYTLRHLSARPVGHNLRFDITFLFRKGIDVTHWPYHDTLLIGHLVDENRDSYSLDSYVKDYYGETYKEDFWTKYKSYEEAPLEERYEYGAADIIYTSKLYGALNDAIRCEGIPPQLVEHVHRLQYALLRTEITGIKIDESYLIDLGVKLKSQIDTLLPQMYDMVETETYLVELDMWQKEIDKRKSDKGKAAVPRPKFSFESPKQLQALIYDTLGLPVQKNEKTKAISVDDASLEKIKHLHPLVDTLQTFRGSNKVYGAYITGTLERMKNGRIYPEFRVNGTVTGRISHANPNLGQLPSKGGVRGIYTPNDGYVLISSDYSQLEVCIEANLTGDASLRTIFTEGLSKHDITSQGLGINRDLAKTLNFAMQYHCSHFKVAKLLGVSEKEGYNVWKKFWEIYSGPKQLKEKTDAMINAGETLVTAFGRKRRFDKKKRSPWDGDYRQGYNFLIQGTGADLTSRAFYLTSEWLKEKDIGRGLFTVHDELIIEVKADYAVEAETQMLSFMTQTGTEIGLQIPLKAQSSGPMERWLD